MREMTKELRDANFADYMFCYFIAWIIMLSFPLWLPIYLAIRVNRWTRGMAQNELDRHEER